MTKPRVAGVAIWLGGNGAGPDQSLANPLGFRGAQLHAWAFPTRTVRQTALHAEGGTTFHFVTGGIQEALDRARDAAPGRDVRIGGGPATIRQYLREGLVDELHPPRPPSSSATASRS